MPICKKCNKTFPNWTKINGKSRNISRRKYCIECSPFGLHNTRIIHIEKSKRYCIACGKELFKRHQVKFCDNACQSVYRWNEIKAKISRGQYDVMPFSGNFILKRFLTETQGAECKKCGLVEWMGQPVPLNVHHKDGDATNNTPNNMELLCLNCHGLTENFGKKNKRCTRKYRYNK